MPDRLAAELALLPEYLGNHLLLSLLAITVGTALSLPLAFIVLRRRRLRNPVMAVAGTIQTVPALALLALMVPLLGRIGFLPAVLALILYSVLPVLRNTVTGIENVSADLIEAGRGLGMTRNQLLFRVELPLALPVIVAGIRTATVWVVGMATLSTPVGATSLGNYIFSGLQTQNYTAVTVGCVAAAGLAWLLDSAIRGIEQALSHRRVRPSSRTVLSAAALALLLASIVGPGFIDGRQRADVVIGTKTFTEQYVLGALISAQLEAAGLRTTILESLGSTVAFDALASGRIDTYVDYTGTIWANYMGRTDNPGREAINAEVERWLAAEHGIGIAARLGFENAYALASTAATADNYGLRAIDDLAAVAPMLRIGGDYEFFSRPEWTALETTYGLQFAAEVTMDSTLMYQAVASGEVDVISAFSSDGRIAAFGLTVLEDPLAALPPYDAIVLTGPDVTDRLPKLQPTLATLNGAITADDMRAANQHVDLEGGTVAAASAALGAIIARRP